MSTSLYMDEHVSRAITLGLRRRGIDVLTVQDDARACASDADLLDRATELSRVFFTQDEDLLVEANHRQMAGGSFAGLVYAHQLKLTIGQIVDDLYLVVQGTEPGELMNTVRFLPL